MSVSLLTTRRAALVAATLTACLALAGCGASATSRTAAAPSAASAPAGPAAKGPHNSADITFATGMIPHHTQAVMMADLALKASKNAQIRALATAIKLGQDPEINTMNGWLRGWAAPAAGSGHDMSSMPSGSMMSSSPHGSGMMSDQQMQGLAGATGVAFDRLWTTMMTEHHTGAIAMARTELAAGQNPEAKALAEQIITAQTSELTAMAALTRTLV